MLNVEYKDWYTGKSNEYIIYSLGDNPGALLRQMEFFGIDCPLPLFGCYKGEKEYSFISPREDIFKIAPYINMAKQESILALGEPRGRHQLPDATLICPRGTFPAIELGKFVQVKERQALDHDAWTYAPHQDAYFVCKRFVA